MKHTGIVRLLVLLLLSLLMAPFVSEAQPTGKVYRIGALDTGSPVASSGRVEAFRKGLRELGLIDGENLRIEWRFADGKELPVSSLAAELVGLKPDVLVALGGAGYGELTRATTEIPIVMAGAHARDVAGSAAGTLAQYQENITGVLSTSRALDEKRMALLREAIPAVSRCGVLLDAVRFPFRPGETTRSERWGFTFVGIPVRDPDEFEGAVARAIKEGADTLSVLDTPMFYTHRQRLADVAVRNHLAWVAMDREYAEAGALMSYGPDGKGLVRQSATYVARILKGAKPWNLPIEQSTKFELLINLKTAKALGLMIPPAVLARADEVIQ
jgi:putative tryptophan/tyrosine transport system substrate-binding protein